MPDAEEGYLACEIKETKGDMVTVAAGGGEVWIDFLKMQQRLFFFDKIVNYAKLFLLISKVKKMRLAIKKHFCT